MKTCPKCGLEKSREDFFINKTNKDGLHSYCKSCHNGYYVPTTEEENKRIYGVGKEKLDIELVKGDRYYIPKIQRAKNKGGMQSFTGRLEQVTKDLIVLRHKIGYCEAFRKIDFLTGELKIERVK